MNGENKFFIYFFAYISVVLLSVADERQQKYAEQPCFDASASQSQRCDLL